MDIPDLAWFKVLLLVAKHSSEDLYSMAGTCKLFEEMLNDPECKEHNNPEIIYREVDEVVNNFRVPAKAGHMESSYTVGLLVLVTPTEGEDDAMEFINCEGNREWYFSWDLAGDYSDTVSTGEVYLLFNVFNSRSVFVIGALLRSNLVHVCRRLCSIDLCSLCACFGWFWVLWFDYVF
ncbi:unnamed protein product [Prunus armeniaca]